LGQLPSATVAAKDALRGAIVLAPPSAITDRWARRLADPVVALASGWMRVRQRAKSRGVELPLVISDHADWDELNATVNEVGAPEVWVTHGREEALIHWMGRRGIRGRALRLMGYGDEDDEGLGPEQEPVSGPETLA
jgi:putative mRNA 3-end processing factor